MKHIKTYENINYNTLNQLADHLLYFLKNITELPITCTYSLSKISDKTFWINTTPHMRKALFKLYEIDYYHGDLSRFFEFETDLSIRLKYADYIPEKILESINFITDIIKNYKGTQNMINFDDIENIIKNINMKNYNIFIDQNKYNL